MAVLGGVHGDEDEGVLAVLRLLREVRSIPLTGTIRAVAPANAAAWAAQSRTSPLDNGNLARSFPGSADDGPTSAAAAAITEHVITGSTALIDLHSAGVRYRMPLMSGYSEQTEAHDESRRLAMAFGAPVIWRHPRPALGRSLSVAADQGIPAIYAECSGGGSIRAGDLDAYVTGVMNVMAELGMVPPEYRRPAAEPRWVHGDGDLDYGAAAAQPGLFVSSVRAGDVVDQGSEIGRLYSFDGDLLQRVDAPGTGMVMFLRRQARTAEMDVLFVLAQLDDSMAAS
nr:M14 family metallopeptidase [Phytoactinopolyspora alkaliphila]